MNKLKSIALASLFATGIAHAGQPCDHFQISVMNNLDEDLLVTRINLDGAKIQPTTFQKLNAHTEQTFTVQETSDGVSMKGYFVFRNKDLKEIKINFDLTNGDIMCKHNNISPPNGQFNVSDEPGIGGAKYTISR